MLPRSKIANASGPRNTPVNLQRASNGTASSTGEVLPVWSQLGGVYFAEIITTGGREFTAAMQVVPLLNAIVKLPYDSVTSTLTQRDRIAFDGKSYNIDAIFNENTNNEKIVCWTTVQQQ
jgi:SPP1 family predicted phage head-tail adaptor